MFDRISDYTGWLLPDDLLSDYGMVAEMPNGMSDEDSRQEDLTEWLHQFYSDNISVEQPVRPNENKTTEIPVQQVVAPEIENSVKQVAGFNRNIISIPCGHPII